MQHQIHVRLRADCGVTSEELLTIVYESLDHFVHGLRLVVMEAWVRMVRVRDIT